MSEAQKAKMMVRVIRAAYGNLEKIDPSSVSYSKLIALLDKADKQMLEILVLARIKFVSPLALNRLSAM